MDDICSGCGELSLVPETVGVVVDAFDSKDDVLGELHFGDAVFCRIKCLGEFGRSLVINKKLPEGTVRLQLVPANNYVRAQHAERD